MHKVWLAAMPHRAALQVLKGKAEIIGPVVRPNSNDPICEVEDAEAALVSAPFPGTGLTLDRAKRLKVVAKFGIGYDNIDLEAATARGICVTNTPDAPTEATAEFTIAVMLDVVRHITFASRRLCAGNPPTVSDQTGSNLAGKKLGLVGLGRVGGRVAEIAMVLGMTVFVYDPYLTEERATNLGVSLVSELSTLLEGSEIVSLHVPLTSETQGMIGAKELARMGSGAILLNISRGAVVVESALIDALREGCLGGAAIDVWDPETPSLDNPLLHMDNVVATPHMAGQTDEAREAGHSSAARQALMVLRGERPPHLLNPEVWPRRKR